MWGFPKIFLSKDFTGYLENNLLWSYLRAMFKEHLSRVDQDRWRASIEGDKNRGIMGQSLLHHRRTRSLRRPFEKARSQD